MKAKTFFARTASIAGIVFLLTSRMGSAQTSTLFTYDFESDDSITTGSLVGQNNWVIVRSSGYITPSVVNNIGPTTGSFTDLSQVVGPSQSTSFPTTAGGAINSNLFTAGSLSAADTLTLTFNLYVTGTSGEVVLFGIGSPQSTYSNGDGEGPTFGISTGSGAAFGFYQGGTAGGSPLQPTASGTGSAVTANHWYSVQSVWNLSNDTATMAVEDLTAGAMTYTPLTFSGSSTINLYATGAAADPASNWNTVYLRMPTESESAGYADNLSVVVSVPEPSTYALLLGGLVLLIGAARRSRFSFPRI